MAAGTPTTIQVQTFNQSTITLDSSTNPADFNSQSRFSDTTEQFENFDESRGWDISCTINSMIDVQRSQCQFGYWNNDEFSFNDDTSMVYWLLLLYNNATDRWLTAVMQTKLPKMPWSIYNLQRTTGGDTWFELNGAEAARNAQQALAEVICYYLNNHSVEVYRAGATPAGINWKSPTYVDGAGGVGTYNAQFIGSGIMFSPVADGTHALTNNFIKVTVNAGWNVRAYFMDGAFGVYNTYGGAFSSGLGIYVGKSSVKHYTMIPVTDMVATAGRISAPVAPTLSPFPYLYNYTSGAGSPQVAYFQVPSTNQWGVGYPGIPAETMPWLNFNGLRVQAEGFFGLGALLPFHRSTTLLNSKYYFIFSSDIYEGSSTSDFGNTRLPSAMVGFIPGTSKERNIWHEYLDGASQAIIKSSNSTSRINYSFRNDSGDSLICQANRVFPIFPPIIPVFTQGQLPHYPDFEWLAYYYGTTSVGSYPIMTSPARLPPNTFITSFQAARKVA